MDERNFRAIARQRLSGNWGTSVLTAFLAFLLGGLIASTGGINLNLYEDLLEELPPEFAQFLLRLLVPLSILAVVNLIIGGVIQLGYARYLLNQHDGRDFRTADLFSQFDRFGTGFVQAFLRNLYVTLWTLLFIVPGIIKNFSYAMTPFILADHPEMTASEAIRASKELMDGHKGDLFVLGLSFFGWSLLGVITLGISNLWTTPYINAAYAAFYREISGQKAPLLHRAQEV